MEDIIINKEKCKRIIGFERYHISESGRIYRTDVDKKRTWRTEGREYINEKKIHFIERQGELKGAYASLTDAEGKLHNVSVSSLVAISFGVISRKINKRKKTIAHKDGNKRNLHYSNLEVVNKVFVNSKLTLKEVKHIKKLIKEEMPLNKIAKLFGVSEMQINRIKTGENWGNGKLKIEKPKAPFEIEDGRIRRYISTFNATETQANLRKTFSVRRNPDNPTDNTIVGIMEGYKLSLKHKNITRAKEIVLRLNEYFFDYKKENKILPSTVYKTT